MKQLNKESREIGYNRETKRFTLNQKPITFEEAKKIWDEVSALWSQGAYNVMYDLIVAGGLK